MKDTKLEEQVQNFKENMRNYETKRFFLFRETTRNTLFRISRNDQNSAKQWPVSYSFVLHETQKEYETVNPSVAEPIYSWLAPGFWRRLGEPNSALVLGLVCNSTKVWIVFVISLKAALRNA